MVRFLHSVETCEVVVDWLVEECDSDKGVCASWKINGMLQVQLGQVDDRAQVDWVIYLDL